jgi:hypothetical protein
LLGLVEEGKDILQRRAVALPSLVKKRFAVNPFIAYQAGILVNAQAPVCTLRAYSDSGTG